MSGVPRSTSARSVTRCSPSLRRCVPSRRPRRGAVALAALAIFAASLGHLELASAQPESRAARLFDAGIADLKLERYEAACAALDESYGLDANLGTLIALADCLERWGKLHSAALRFEELIAAASGPNASPQRAPQLDYARQAIARLGPEVPRLELQLPPAFEPEASVLLDGRPLDTSTELRELGADPGRHVIETRAPGREPWRIELELSAGEHRRVDVELGREQQPEPPPPSTAPSPASPSAEPAPAGPVTPAPSASSQAPAPEGGPWRTVGWSLGALGVAGIGVGAVAGVMLLDECPSFDCGSRERAKDLALVTDIGFGVGLAALAASAFLLLTTDAPARDGGQSAESAAWRPLGGVDTRGGWLGVSHSF